VGLSSPKIVVAEWLPPAAGEGLEGGDFAANRRWAHVDSNHGPLSTANGRRPESVKLLGWTEATARGVFLPRHEEAFDLRAEEAVAESPLHRPQVTL
jgi:hypothetical protein